MLVKNMTSNNGNKIANQFIIEDDNATYFQSYESMIVKIEDNGSLPDKVYLDEVYYNYSKTTSKYRNIFLNMTTKEIDNKIKSGLFILTNLN
jgi:hypothetical protein